MFHTTTHFKYWIFSDEIELNRRRQLANENFINENISKLTNDSCLLTMKEESTLINYYLIILKDFCRKFKPPMPKFVISTAIQYFKRFYLNNSVMEHHPKHIMVTCVYLAAKIEEFNVSMQQFVTNIRGDREKASDIVLNNELLLLHRLNYHLIIWHPYRPIEGFLIDLKTRYPECKDPEKFRKNMDTFLDKSFSTDACFLLTPNQIALLSLIHAAEQFNESLDDYLRILFANQVDEIKFLKKWMNKLLQMMRTIENPTKDAVKIIEKKLEQCQLETSSGSDDQQKQIDDEDETVSYERYSQFRNEQEQLESQIMERAGKRS